MKIIIVTNDLMKNYSNKIASELSTSNFESIVISPEQVKLEYDKTVKAPSFYIEKHGKLCNSLIGKQDIATLKKWIKDFTNNDSTY